MKPLFDFDGNGKMDELEFLLATGAISPPGNDNPLGNNTNDGLDDGFDNGFDDSGDGFDDNSF